MANGAPVTLYGTLANRPSAIGTNDGSVYRTTDTNQEFQAQAGTWVEIAFSVGPSARPLVVDGQLLREGSTTGPRYRATGYNIHVGTDSYPTNQSLTTYAALDKYFRQLRPNSLTRLRAYAPGSNTGRTWAQQLAWYDTVVAAAQANNQRLIFVLTGWGSGQQNWDALQPLNTAWVTGQSYLASVSGTVSYENWVKAIVARYKGNYTVSMYDLVNEPSDGGSNTAAFQTWFNTAYAWIKAIDPNILVYFGQTTGGFTAAAYQTLCSGLDLCSTHSYQNYGWLPIVTGQELPVTDILGKPLIVDESGVWAKDFYDATDLSPESQGAISSQAQGVFWKEMALRMLSYPEVCSVLYYSYMDTDAGQGFTDGAGHFEPNVESMTSLAVRTVDLNGDPFNQAKMSSMIPSTGVWMDGIQAMLTAPGTALSSFTNWINNSSGAITSGPISGTWNGHPSFLFTGTQIIKSGFWKPQTSTQSFFFSFVPTSNPGASAYYYLSAPQGTSTNGEGGIRINSAGKIELTVTAITATPTPAGDTIVGTSSNAVNVNDVNTLAVVWNASASTSNGYTAGTWVIILNGVLTTGVQQKTLSATQNGQVGIDYDGTTAGFQGHILQALFEPVCETAPIRAQTLAYLSRKYATRPQ